MNRVFIGAAKRTLVSPRNQRWKSVPVPNLAAPVVKSLAAMYDSDHLPIDEVVFGSALYGGGNPARLISLEAGLSEKIFASTIDTQCCSGLDAIISAANKVASGCADVIIAGGVESYSRSPIRQHRAFSKNEEHTTYQRPPFTPWPDRDPDLLQAAADFASKHKISRHDQEVYTCSSHLKALAADFTAELVQALSSSDDFTRKLSLSACERLPPLVGDPQFGLTSATVAVEADAAAAVLVLSEKACNVLGLSDVVRVLGYRQVGGAADEPILSGLYAARSAIENLKSEVCVFELMESFAVQAIAWSKTLAFDQRRLNRGGGALARGHPIAASGAILIVRLFHELMKEVPGSIGLSAIAAAGGLGSSMLLQKC